MSLLFLFNSSNPPPGASTSEPYTTVLLETEDNIFADISADLRNGYTNRGKQQELQRFQPGTCTLEFSNADRAYDSRVNSYIKPGRRLQVLASYGGTTWPQFTGKVDGWSEKSNGPNDAVAICQGTDVMKDMNKAELPRSVFVAELEITAEEVGEPVHWLTFDEAMGDAIRDYGSTPLVETFQHGSPVQGSAPLISRHPGASIALDGTTGQGVTAIGTEVGLTTTGGFTLETVITVDSGSGTRRIFQQGIGLVNKDGIVGAIYISVAYSGANFWFSWTMDDISTLSNVTSEIRAAIGATYHVAFVLQSDMQMKIYVNGVDDTDTPFDDWVGATIPRRKNFTVGSPQSSFLGSLIGDMDEFLLWQTPLSAERLAAHAEAVSTPWNNDSPGQRMGRLLDFLAVPEGLRDLEEGSSTLQSATLGISALEYAYKVGESEFGPFFVTAGGVIRLDDRHNQLNKSSEGTFSDQPDAALVYRDSTPKYDDSLIKNPVTISRSEGVAQTVQDQDLIDNDYGINSFSIDGLLHDSDDLSRDAAEFILAEYKEPKRRIVDLTIGPVPAGKEAAMYPQMLGRELTEKVTVTEHPQGVDPVSSQESIIEGISQTFGPKHWQTKWNLSPAVGGEVGFWQIGTPGHSEIGLTTRVGF